MPLDPSRRRALATSLLGLSFWGTWAFIANGEHPQERWIAAMTQGTMSFALSGAVALLAERIWAETRGPWRRAATVVVPVLLASGLSVSAHLLVGTPRIVATALPPFLVGLVYSRAYVAVLERQSPAGLRTSIAS